MERLTVQRVCHSSLMYSISPKLKIFFTLCLKANVACSACTQHHRRNTVFRIFNLTASSSFGDAHVRAWRPLTSCIVPGSGMHIFNLSDCITHATQRIRDYSSSSDTCKRREQDSQCCRYGHCREIKRGICDVRLEMQTLFIFVSWS